MSNWWPPIIVRRNRPHRRLRPVILAPGARRTARQSTGPCGQMFWTEVVEIDFGQRIQGGAVKCLVYRPDPFPAFRNSHRSGNTGGGAPVLSGDGSQCIFAKTPRLQAEVRPSKNAGEGILSSHLNQKARALGNTIEPNAVTDPCASRTALALFTSSSPLLFFYGARKCENLITQPMRMRAAYSKTGQRSSRYNEYRKHMVPLQQGATNVAGRAIAARSGNQWQGPPRLRKWYTRGH